MKVNVDGKEVEVLTAEEAQAKADEAAAKALDSYKSEHPDQTESVTKLQSDLKKAQEDLDAASKGGNSAQVERLRKERDEAQKLASEGIAQLTKDFADFRNGSINEVKGTLLNQYAGTNKDLREKIEIEFGNYKPNANTKADIEERMAKAFQLATGTKATPRMTDGIAGGGARGDGYSPTVVKEESANGAAMRKAFGITDEQMKKGQEVLKKIK